MFTIDSLGSRIVIIWLRLSDLPSVVLLELCSRPNLCCYSRAGYSSRFLRGSDMASLNLMNKGVCSVAVPF